MRRLSSQTINDINARVDILSVVGEYVDLKKKGSDWWGCCPFHSEKTPSFHVVPDRNMYHCFGCGKGGGLISFYMEMEKLNFGEAVENLAKKNGIEIIYEGGFADTSEQDKTKEEMLDLYKRVSSMFHYILINNNEGSLAKNYIEKRGLSPHIIEQFMIGYSPKNRFWLRKFLLSKNYSPEFLEKTGLFSKKYSDISFFTNRLMFPIWNRNGQVIAFGARLLEGDGPKYLNSSEMPQYKKGETLYAFHLAKQTIRETKTIILCEGYMDVIAYHQAGIKNAVAPLGTALTAEQIKLFKPFVENVILAFDSDTAGLNATKKAIVLCRQNHCVVKIFDPKKYFGDSLKNIPKDPAEILEQQGAEVLTNIINTATIDCDFLLSLLAENFSNSSEGKLKACLDFFWYIDALQSDVQKDACLEQLSETFNLSFEAVKNDYKNQGVAKKRLSEHKVQAKTSEKNIKKDAELRLMLASIVNIKFYPLVRASLSSEDFENEYARELFFTMEECLRKDSMTFDFIFEKCSDENLRKLISNTIATEEFVNNAQKIIEDGIQLIKRNSLIKRRNNILTKIRQYSSKGNDQSMLKSLIEEKMLIDTELKKENK
ncbi:MAG: DNA primase [Treponemataceae bacterium]